MICDNINKKTFFEENGQILEWDVSLHDRVNDEAMQVEDTSEKPHEQGPILQRVVGIPELLNEVSRASQDSNGRN